MQDICWSVRSRLLRIQPRGESASPANAKGLCALPVSVTPEDAVNSGSKPSNPVVQTGLKNLLFFLVRHLHRNGALQSRPAPKTDEEAEEEEERNRIRLISNALASTLTVCYSPLVVNNDS